jgi:hypothetical protein
VRGDQVEVVVDGRRFITVVEADSGEKSTGGRSLLVYIEEGLPSPPFALDPERGAALLLFRADGVWRDIVSGREVDVEGLRS